MAHIPKPSGVMDLKTMAISRLMLDNFPHIKAYWVMLGLKTAQVALSFGADDLDGTVVHEKIYHEAGAETPQEATVAEIRRLIAEAGRDPGRARHALSSRRARRRRAGPAREHIDVPAWPWRGRTDAELAAVIFDRGGEVMSIALPGQPRLHVAVVLWPDGRRRRPTRPAPG